MLEEDIRLELKETADREALRFLAQHLRQVLLSPTVSPVRFRKRWFGFGGHNSLESTHHSQPETLPAGRPNCRHQLLRDAQSSKFAIPHDLTQHPGQRYSTCRHDIDHNQLDQKQCVHLPQLTHLSTDIPPHHRHRDAAWPRPVVTEEHSVSVFARSR